MNPKQEFAQRLKAARKNAGFKTAKSFIETGEFPHSTYVQYETGRRMPKEEVIHRFCKLFNVNFDWLKFGHGEPLKNAKTSAIIEGELLDLNAESLRPHELDEALFMEVVEQVLDFAEKAKLSKKKIALAAVSIYSDIIRSEPDRGIHKNMIKPLLAAFQRYN